MLSTLSKPTLQVCLVCVCCICTECILHTYYSAASCPTQVNFHWRPRNHSLEQGISSSHIKFMIKCRQTVSLYASGFVKGYWSLHWDGLIQRFHFKSCLTSQVSSLHVDEGFVAKDHWVLVLLPPLPALPWLLLHLPPEAKSHSSLFRSCVIYTHSTMGLYKDSTSLRVFWSARVASASHRHWAILVSTLMVNRSCLQCLNSDVPDWLMLPCPSLSAFTAAHAAYHTNSDFILWSYAIMHCVCTF